MVNRTFDFVCVVENTPSMAWQAKLFHNSCVQYNGLAPTTMVMNDGSAEFHRDLSGLRVQRAPNYRSRGVPFPPRNTPAALLHLESEADYVVLCDSDMVFVDRWPFASSRIGDRQITMDYTSYMKVDHESISPVIASACKRAGLSLDALREYLIGGCGAVPYVIPKAVKNELAREWLHCEKFFSDPGSTPHWVSGMWWLVFAAYRLGLDLMVTVMTTKTNFSPRQLCPGWRMVHYLYPDEWFDKAKVRLRDPNTVRAPSGTVTEAVCEQYRQIGFSESRADS